MAGFVVVDPRVMVCCAARLRMSATTLAVVPVRVGMARRILGVLRAPRTKVLESGCSVAVQSLTPP